MTVQMPQSVQSGTPQPAKEKPELRAAAEELEAAFLAEMLKSAGLGDTPGAFGGGAGESQFASLLVQAQAREIVRGGGLGLAETLFNALVETENGT